MGWEGIITIVVSLTECHIFQLAIQTPQSSSIANHDDPSHPIVPLAAATWEIQMFLAFAITTQDVYSMRF